LVNLCVSLANACITPLAVSTDDSTRSGSNAEIIHSLPPAASTTKKGGAKGDPQATPTTSGPSGSSSIAVKNEDLKTALEVSHLFQKRQLKTFK
jgi:hypothetical protein